jgi:HEPN domain-containing protein
MRDEARAEAERWVAQAENDLAFAEHGLGLGFFAQTCFLAQQSAEKAAKALHYARGARIVMGHSVDGLLAPLESDLPKLGALRDGAKELDQHYLPTRYPNGLPGNVPFRAYTAEQARRALGQARSIVAFARAALAAG